MSNSIDVVFIGVPGPTGPGALTTAAEVSVGPVQVAANTFTPVNTSTNAVTLQAPTSPVDGSLFSATDVTGNAAANNITAVPEGAGVTIVAGVISTNYGTRTWRYVSATLQWVPVT